MCVLFGFSSWTLWSAAVKLERVSPFLGGQNLKDKADKALANSEVVSLARRMTTLELKELNERQRAEHAHKMYEQIGHSLRQVEERNLELEAKFAEVRCQTQQGIVFWLLPHPARQSSLVFESFSLMFLFFFLCCFFSPEASSHVACTSFRLSEQKRISCPHVITIRTC